MDNAGELVLTEEDRRDAEKYRRMREQQREAQARAREKKKNTGRRALTVYVREDMREAIKGILKIVDAKKPDEMLSIIRGTPDPETPSGFRFIEVLRILNKEPGQEGQS